jgi:exosortase
VLFAYLIYRKRKMLRAVAAFESPNQPRKAKHLVTLSGILLCVIAILLYWYWSSAFNPTDYHILTMPIFIAGLMLTLFNLQTLRQALFPIVFLLFFARPLNIFDWIGSILSVVSSEVSNAVVRAVGIPSTISGEYGNPTIVITRPDGNTIPFTVDIACSGIYSLIGFLIFAAFIAYITRDKAWKKTAIFLIGLPLIYLLNVLRIVIILLIGYQFGEQLALQLFHLLGGWILIFLGTLVLLTITEKVFKTQMFAKAPYQDTCGRCNPSSSDPVQSFCANCGRLLRYPEAKLRRSDIAKIGMMAAVLVLLISIQPPVFALTKGQAWLVTGEQGNPQVLPQIEGYALSFEGRETGFEEVAKQDAALMYAYTPNDETKDTVWVAIEVAKFTTSLHDWETCLVTWPQTHGYQSRIAQLDLREIKILQNPPLPAKYFAFQYTDDNMTQLVLYWRETSILTIDNVTQREYVKISLVTYPETPESVPDAENKLLPFATAIADYWQPIKTWTQVALLISNNGDMLAVLMTVLLTSVGIYQTYEKRRERIRGLNVYQKLSRSDKRTVDILRQTEKKSMCTLSNAAAVYRNATHREIMLETLREKLVQIEKTGLVRSEIANRQDEPVQTWKADFESSRLRRTLQKLINILHRSKKIA